MPIAEFLLARAAKQNNVSCPALSVEVCETLKAYSWPGNVRELDNVMQRALILQMSGTITANDIQFEHASHQAPVSESMEIGQDMIADGDNSLSDDLKVREQNMIIEALKETMGSRKSAAEKLGISPRTLRYKLARMRERGVAIPVN